MRIAIPAVLDIPEPRFVPQHNDAIDEAVRVVQTAPRVLAELDQRRWFILVIQK